MAKRTQRKIDKVRASRDGHEFHEAWASRKALQLIMPNDRFVGINVDGIAPADQKNASSETVEIVDLMSYSLISVIIKQENEMTNFIEYSAGKVKNQSRCNVYAAGISPHPSSLGLRAKPALVLYYGNHPTFDEAHSVVTVH